MDAQKSSILRIPYLSMRRRFRRRFRYGARNIDRLSLPLSELAVSYFNKNAPYDDLDMEFATSLSREACVNPCTLVVAMLYLERVRAGNAEYFKTSDPAHLYLISMLVANKYIFDQGVEDFVYNDEWATSANLPLKQVNEEEVRFLKSLDWSTNVNSYQFFEMLNQMETRIALADAARFPTSITYADIDILTAALFRNDVFILLKLIADILKFMGFAMVAYFATISIANSCAVWLATRSSGTSCPSFQTTLTRPPSPLYHSWTALMDQDTENVLPEAKDEISAGNAAPITVFHRFENSNTTTTCFEPDGFFHAEEIINADPLLESVVRKKYHYLTNFHKLPLLKTCLNVNTKQSLFAFVLVL